jgi:hypothetical protein
MNLGSEIVGATATVTVMFLAIGSLLWLGRRIEERRASGIARQIALTDAIHFELGAVAAPEVRKAWLGGWTISMAVPLEREGTVGAVVRIASDLFSALDRVDAPRIRIVLAPQEQRLTPKAAPTPAPPKLTRAGAQLGSRGDTRWA